MQPARTIAEAALELIQDGMNIGLGSGRAARQFVEALGRRTADGLRLHGVPTSQETAALATRCGIPLTTLDDVDALDLTVDGADEVDPQLNLIKGWGGALVREKIVAAASKRLVILVGEEKLVNVLGSRGRLPVEVVPFGLVPCRRKLLDLGFASQPRAAGEKLFVTDNGNHILDCDVQELPFPHETDRELLAIPGVVGTGLFLGMADTVLVQRGHLVEILSANKPAADDEDLRE